MPSTFFGLDIAVSGIYTAQTGINTTGHNISNENTPGYSRQVAAQSAKDALRIYAKYGMVGTGSQITEITQLRDSYYDIKYWTNNTKHSEHVVKNYYMDQVESYFNEMIYDGFTKEYDNFFNSFVDLENNPGDMVVRNSVLNFGQSLCDYISSIQQNFIKLQEDLNSEVSNKVAEINTITAEIATLNKQINTVEMNGSNANDLRDKRVLLLDQLSAIVPISVNEETSENGRTFFTVKVSGHTLVDNYDYNALNIVSRDKKHNDTDAAGLYDIQFADGWSFDVEAMGIDGELRALFDLRDGNNNTLETDNDACVAVDYKGVPHYLDRLGEFVSTITKAFNDIHHKGVDSNGNSTADVDIFVTLPNGNWGVNPLLLDKPSLMATSTDNSAGVEKGDLAKEMLALKDAKLFASTTGTAKYFMQSVVTEISMSKNKAETLEKNYENIKLSISNQRLSVSGVDGDEEAMNLVKYQEAFELSAKMIQIMQEIYNKLINETGL